MRTNNESGVIGGLMTAVVSLRRVAEEMDLPNPDWTAYLSRTTGEIVVVTNDDIRALESLDEGADDLPDWQVENLPQVREALECDDFLALPGRIELDEYRLLQNFCLGVEDERLRDRLLVAICGKGAFGRFKALAGEHGLLEAWYACRQRVLEALAADWLEANGIAFMREA